MKVSYNKYKEMNEFLRFDLRKEFNKVLSFDTDSELYNYQSKGEKYIGKFLGRGYAIGTSCGTAALSLTQKALDIKGEVITVAHTYISTALSISEAGAIPKFIDVNPNTMLIDDNLIEDAITEKTRAIIPVHLYGQMANMPKINRIAKKYNLHIIEDACQAHLAKYNGKMPGENSDATCYSFFLNKNLGGISNGGMAITKNKKLKKTIDIFRNPDSDNPLVLKSFRTPAYLDWIQQTFIRCKLKYLDEWIKKKRQIAKRYCEELDGHISIPETDKKAYHTYRNFVIRVKNRDKLKKYLAKKGIETHIHYNTPIHLSNTYKHLKYKKGSLPVSEKISSSILSLPINPFITRTEQEYVIKNIKKFIS